MKTAPVHSDGKVWDTTKEADAVLGPTAPIMRAMGLWQPPGGRPAGARLLVAAFVVIFFTVSIACGIAKIVTDPPAEQDTFREAIFTYACTFTWEIRIVAIIVRQSQIQQLVLDVLHMRKRFTQNAEVFRKSYSRRAIIVCIVWVAFPLVGIPMWFVEPALTKTVVTTAENTTIVIRKTPVIMWMPMDTQTHPNYEITYVIQLVIICFIVQMNVVVDLFFACLMINITADLAILNNNIANMRLSKEDGFLKKSAEGVKISAGWEIKYKSKKSLEAEGEYDDSTTAHASTTPESRAKLYRTLVKNIQHHQYIMSIINDLESIMSESSVLMLAVNSVNICIQGLGFVDAFRPGAKRSTALKKVLTFPAYVNQTAHFCWYGQEIIDQSERLLLAAFSCGWAEADARFCSSLRIFMIQTSRPLMLQIGKIFPLSRNLFLQILNTSYTIFNMMINF